MSGAVAVVSGVVSGCGGARASQARARKRMTRAKWIKSRQQIRKLKSVHGSESKIQKLKLLKILKQLPRWRCQPRRNLKLLFKNQQELRRRRLKCEFDAEAGEDISARNARGMGDLGVVLLNKAKSPCK